MIGYTYHLAFNDPDFEDYFSAYAMRGDVGELRIYDRVLSDGEIVYLSGVSVGEGAYMPVPSTADIYFEEPEGQRRVNFKDYALLMQYWLTEQLFPPED